MTPAARHRLTATTLVLGEGYFYVRYAASGAEFHFWLHALLGGALGLWLLTAARLWRPRTERWRAHQAVLAGHAYSALPDVLFLAVGALHVASMDVFALHITAHFLWPDPLLAGVVLWGLGVAGWVALRLGRRRAAQAALLASVVLLGSAFLLRSDAPTSLQDVVEGGSNGLGEQALSWVCRVEV